MVQSALLPLPAPNVQVLLTLTQNIGVDTTKPFLGQASLAELGLGTAGLCLCLSLIALTYNNTQPLASRWLPQVSACFNQRTWDHCSHFTDGEKTCLRSPSNPVPELGLEPIFSMP